MPNCCDDCRKKNRKRCTKNCQGLGLAARIAKALPDLDEQALSPDQAREYRELRRKLREWAEQDGSR